MIPYYYFHTSNIHYIFFDMAVIQMPLAQIKLLSLIKYGDIDITHEIDFENCFLYDTIFVAEDNTMFYNGILRAEGDFCPECYYHAEYSMYLYHPEYGLAGTINNTLGYGFGEYGRQAIGDNSYNGQSDSMIQHEADE